MNSRMRHASRRTSTTWVMASSRLGTHACHDQKHLPHKGLSHTFIRHPYESWRMRTKSFVHASKMPSVHNCTWPITCSKYECMHAKNMKPSHMLAHHCITWDPFARMQGYLTRTHTYTHTRERYMRKTQGTSVFVSPSRLNVRVHLNHFKNIILPTR